jgi:hypothetical protein
VNDQEANLDELWQVYLHAEKAADESLRPFLAALPHVVGFQSPLPDSVGFLAPHLQDSDSIYALRVLERCPELLRRRLLPDLVAAASTARHEARLMFLRSAIASLDRTWLEANIEPQVWRQLGPGATDEQYRLLAELLLALGLRDVLQSLVDRAVASPDKSIRDIAEDFRS